jgi:hypothetical protein
LEAVGGAVRANTDGDGFEQARADEAGGWGVESYEGVGGLAAPEAMLRVDHTRNDRSRRAGSRRPAAESPRIELHATATCRAVRWDLDEVVAVPEYMADAAR